MNNNHSLLTAFIWSIMHTCTPKHSKHSLGLSKIRIRTQCLGQHLIPLPLVSPLHHSTFITLLFNLIIIFFFFFLFVIFCVCGFLWPPWWCGFALVGFLFCGQEGIDVCWMQKNVLFIGIWWTLFKIYVQYNKNQGKLSLRIGIFKSLIEKLT